MKPLPNCTCNHCTTANQLDGPWEFGTLPAQGRRNDLEAVATVMKEQGIEAVVEQMPGMIIRYHKGLQVLNSYYQAIERKRVGWLKPTIRVYYGSTGVGKTRHCWQKYPDLYRVACHTGGTTWFDGYAGEKVILFDDFHGGMPFRLLLQMLDGYPLRMQVKGTFVMLYGTVFLFTTNVHPDEWYFNDRNNKAELIAPLQRRIQQYGRIVDMPKVVTATTIPPTTPASPDSDALTMSAQELIELHETFKDYY